MEKKIKATYTGESKHYYFFLIDDGQFTGTLFVRKDKPVPDTVTIHLSTKAEKKQKPC